MQHQKCVICLTWLASKKSLSGETSTTIIYQVYAEGFTIPHQNRISIELNIVTKFVHLVTGGLLLYRLTL